MSDPRPIAFIEACPPEADREREAACSRYLTEIANGPLIGHVIDAAELAGVEVVAIRARQRERVALAAALADRREISFIAGEDQTAIQRLLTQAGARPLLALSGDSLLGEDLIAICRALDLRRCDAIALSAPPRRRWLGHVEGLGDERACAEPIAMIASADAWRRVAAEQEVVGLRSLPRAFELAGLRVRSRQAKRGWCFSDDPRQLLVANLMLLDALPPGGPEYELPDGSAAQGRVMIDPSATVLGSRLRGPVLIGAEARIEDSFIGPYTTVGPRASVIGAEIEYAMVMAGAAVRYPGQRLEESVIGERAVIARSFALPSGAHLRVDADATVILS
jgi:glucose-1-phosphate thymidylyltransferase